MGRTDGFTVKKARAVHILFDLDDTLYDQLIPFETSFRQSGKACGAIPMEELYKAYRHYSDKVFHKTENGEMSLGEMYIYRISRAFADFGIRVSEREALRFQRDYADAQKSIRLLPDVTETLDYCRATNIAMGIITNGPTAHQQDKIEHLGLHAWIKPEHVFISSQVGFAKPDRRIFERAEKMMRLVPQETYFAGDSLANDVAGAKNAGWKAIWCNRRSHAWPKAAPRPDYVVGKGGSLAEAVESIANASMMTGANVRNDSR